MGVDGYLCECVCVSAYAISDYAMRFGNDREIPIYLCCFAVASSRLICNTVCQLRAVGVAGGEDCQVSLMLIAHIFNFFSIFFFLAKTIAKALIFWHQS